jgi:hypothetical protein
MRQTPPRGLDDEYDDVCCFVAPCAVAFFCLFFVNNRIYLVLLLLLLCISDAGVSCKTSTRDVALQFSDKVRGVRNVTYLPIYALNSKK